MLIGTSLDIVNTTLGGTGMNSGAISEPALDALTFAQDFENSVGTGTFTRASNAWNPDTGELCADNVPRYVAGRSGKGILIEGARTNSFLNSGTPVTQDISVTTSGSGYWICSVYGSGSVTSSAGTAIATGYGVAVAGVPNVIKVTSNGSVTYTVNGADVTTKVQVENATNFGPWATSYIPTTGIPINRAIDVLSYPTGVITPSQGTVSLWIKVAQWFQGSTTTVQFFNTYLTTTTHIIALSKSNTANMWRWNVRGTGADDTYITTTCLSDGWHHFAGTWDANESALWVDGVKCTIANGFSMDPRTPTDGIGLTVPSTLSDTFAVGLSNNLTAGHCFTPIDNLRIYNRPLTAAEMNQLFRSGGGIMRDTQLKVTTDGDLFASNGDYIFVRS